MVGGEKEQLQCSIISLPLTPRHESFPEAVFRCKRGHQSVWIFFPFLIMICRVSVRSARAGPDTSLANISRTTNHPYRAL